MFQFVFMFHSGEMWATSAKCEKRVFCKSHKDPMSIFDVIKTKPLWLSLCSFVFQQELFYSYLYAICQETICHKPHCQQLRIFQS